MNGYGGLFIPLVYVHPRVWCLDILIYYDMFDCKWLRYVDDLSALLYRRYFGEIQPLEPCSPKFKKEKRKKHVSLGQDSRLCSLSPHYTYHIVDSTYTHPHQCIAVHCHTVFSYRPPIATYCSYWIAAHNIAGTIRHSDRTGLPTGLPGNKTGRNGEQRTTRTTNLRTHSDTQ